MRIVSTVAIVTVTGCLTITAAQAACTGSNGRGWGSGKGAGAFEMSTGDKECRISFPGVINEQAGTRIPATEVSVTQPPKSGKIKVVKGRGILYTPNAGFKGRDRFCTRNTTPKAPGVTLSGCITVSVK